MRSGLFNSDDYLNHWRTVDLPERKGQLGAEAAKPEATYPDARLDELGTKGGQA